MPVAWDPFRDDAAVESVMEPVDWLEAHRDAILGRWKMRMRPVAGEGGDARWEQRVSDCFDQICVLAAGASVEVAEADVEENLFKCVAIQAHEGHAFTARMFVYGREAIGGVLRESADPGALQCSEKCGRVIDYLQHMLRMNVCRECKEINCCMRLGMLEPIPGGVNE